MCGQRFLQPMPFRVSLLCFGIPSAIGWLGLYAGLPLLAQAGVPLFWNYLLCLVGPIVLLTLAAFAAYRLEGRPWSWDGLRARFRLRAIKGRDWLWTAALMLAMPASYLVLLPSAGWLASFPLFAPPAFLPSIVDPRLAQSLIPTEYLGIPLLGNWWVPLAHLVILCFNVFGEEFWWRGYILPRQELVHGDRTWVVHGVLWTLFHSFWKWNLLAILPGALLLSFVAQRLKNTTPAILGHWAMNILGLVAILAGVLGITA